MRGAAPISSGPGEFADTRSLSGTEIDLSSAGGSTPRRLLLRLRHMRDEILAILTRLYAAGTIPCSDQLGVALLSEERQVRIWAPISVSHVVRFGEEDFVAAILACDAPVTEVFVRMMLCLAYYDPESFPWVTREKPALPY